MDKTEIPRATLSKINSMMEEAPKREPMRPQFEEPRCVIVVKLKSASFERYRRIAEANQMALNEYVMFCLERCDEQVCDWAKSSKALATIFIDWAFQKPHKPS